ncbi:6225_t:CDS:2 [Paraglomus brasilianum]|uniref:6225_t:CDS:1 n=1 Tax=Paraglomus brasilianum TaxID=144538 RepID=A0A9N9AMD3_9GLOM|nr:6225_t:CDS:2 [Paraglomus brasilianum]
MYSIIREKTLSTESLIQSWTIDLSDLETKRLFSDEDWCEIKKVQTTADLRKVIESTSYWDKNEPFDQESHFDAEWAELVLRNL